VLTALLLGFLVAVHGAEQVFDVVDETLAVGEAAKEEGLRQCGHSGLLYSIQVRRQFWQVSLLQEGHMRGFFTFWKQM
jgi:hypothetical protein